MKNLVPPDEIYVPFQKAIDFDVVAVFGVITSEIKYIQSTPKREAADALYEALKSRQVFDDAYYWKHTQKPKRFWVRYERLINAKERAALALANGAKEMT